VPIFSGRWLCNLGFLPSCPVAKACSLLVSAGKTLILEKVLKEFYEAEDVGILSNKGEELFGLSAIFEKNLFFCSEVNHQFNLEQSKFQQMVSGESVSIPIKYKTAVSQPFKPHGFLAGNETFRLKDVSGSLTRRVVPFHFNHPVVNADPDLSKRLKREAPMILLKANLAYHWATQQVVRDGRQIDFWSLKIPYFMDTRRQFANSLDPLRGFLSDPGNGLLIARGCLHLYMPLDVLLEKVRSGVGSCPSSTELAQNGIWAEMGLLLFFRTGRDAIDPPYPRYTNLRLTKRCWIFGIDALGDDEGEVVPEEGLPAELHDVVAAEYARCFPG
jgi:hypothetical protein